MNLRKPIQRHFKRKFKNPKYLMLYDLKELKKKLKKMI